MTRRTGLGFAFKILRTLFYVALLWTVIQQGFGLLQTFLGSGNTDGYGAVLHFLIQFLKHLVGIFVYVTLLTLVAALVISEFAEETDEELRSTGRYAVHQRKIDSGYLKNKNVQTNSGSLDNLGGSESFRVSPQDDIEIEADEDMKTATAQVDTNEDLVVHDVIDIYKGVLNPGAVNEDVTTPQSTTTFKLDFPDRADFKETRQTISSPVLSSTDELGNNTLTPFSSDSFVAAPACKTTFQDLGGMDKLRHILDVSVITPLVSGSNDAPRGIMLIGSPGTGKSCIVQALVNEFRNTMKESIVKLYVIESCKCFGSFVGPGVTFQNLFHEALESSSLAVLLFENVDQLYDKSISAFLSALTSLPPAKALVVTTAKKRDAVNEQLVEIGKLDYIFELELPDFQGRREILRIHFEKRECPVEEDDLIKLAGLTAAFSGRELENLTVVINTRAVERYDRNLNSSKIDPEPILRESGDHNSLVFHNGISLPLSFAKEDGGALRNLLISALQDQNGNKDRQAKQKYAKSFSTSGSKATIRRSISASSTSTNSFDYDTDSDSVITKLAKWITDKEED